MSDFPVPQGIPTHVTLGELRLLQQFAHEAGTVLEIGTYLGFTCIGMALAGAHVTSVDPHVHDADGRIDTWDDFLTNVDRHRVPAVWPEESEGINWERLTLPRMYVAAGGSIIAIRRKIEDVELPTAALDWLHGEEWFGMGFIDGDHIWPAPIRDVRVALAHLRTPGYVALHDVTPNWPGVWRTHCELTASGELDQVACERYLRVYRARGYQSSASGVCGKSSTPSVAE